MESAATRMTLGEMLVGARLIVQCKKDWRGAVVSKLDAEKATLIVCSPTGGTYRLSRVLATSVFLDGKFFVLHNGCEDEKNWRDNFVKYDARW